MQPAYSTRALDFGLSIALACAMAGARADEPDNTLKIGYAHIGFNTTSGDLTGPAGTTPPGIQADLDDADALALVYERNVWGRWAVLLQVGTRP